MKKRVLTAVVALAVLLPILWFSDKLPFVVLLSAASVGAVLEGGRCFGIKPSSAVVVPFYIFAAVLPFVFRFLPGYDFLRIVFAALMLAVLFVFSAVTLGGSKVSFVKASSLCSFLIYILAGLNAILIVRDNASYRGEFMFMLIFLGAWITDAGAQLTGIAFGKHKLIPQVSPNKTVEGAVGGAVCGVLGYAAYAAIVKFIYNVNVNWLALVLLGLVIAVVDQLGDLIASRVKREHGIKDFGSLFPGHGGVIDRIDSIVSNAIVILAYTVFGLPLIFFN